MTNKDKIGMFIPFEIVKGKECVDSKGKKRKMVFKGIASNMNTGEDMDGEILDPNGFDYSGFLKSGHINYNHMASRDPLAIVGEPTSAKVVNNEFHIEGFLYEESELAQKIYKAAEILEKSGSTRRLGFSIEGNARQRDPHNKKKITKADITNVAIAPTPKNAGTSMELVKGLTFEHVESVTNDMVIDVTADGERVLINDKLQVEIVKAHEVVLTEDEFNKAMRVAADAATNGDILGGQEIIKSGLSTFRGIFNKTLWVGGAVN